MSELPRSAPDAEPTLDGQGASSTPKEAAASDSNTPDKPGAVDAFVRHTAIPWHLAFAGMITMTIVAIVPNTSPALWDRSVYIAIGALGAIAAAYAALLVPKGPFTGAGRINAYLIVMVTLLPIAVFERMSSTLFLFIGFTHTWALLGSRKMGTIYTGLLAVGVGAAIAGSEGFTSEAIAFGVGTTVISFGFSVAMGFSILGLIERSQEKTRLAAELAEAQRSLAKARWAESLSAERERMAQDIHDTLAQGFTSIVMLAQVAGREARAGRMDAAADRIDLIESAARENLAEARALVADAAPVRLDAGIGPALTRLARRFAEETSLEVDVAVEPLAPAPQRDVVLLRACQEALANVRKHAEARRVWVVLAAVGDRCQLTVSDDGRGLPITPRPGVGLESMTARANAIGGDFSIGTREGGGTILRVTAPLRRSESRPTGPTPW